MCDLDHGHERQAFGYLVDTPEIRALIDETRRIVDAFSDIPARVEALKPAVSRQSTTKGHQT